VRDPQLLAYLAEHRVPLEVCPTSNIATRAVPELAQHPVAEMAAAGVLVTINSDDPPMFSTDLNTEYAIAAELLQLDQAGVAALAANAVTASFAPQDVKSRVLAEIEAYTTGAA
jgi:aminodeoxyfutalosine deaminase